MKISSVKVAVVIIARNESEFIQTTLENLLNQDLKPYRIIVVNDGSTDNTGNISAKLGVEVINRSIREDDLRSQKGLTETINIGLKTINEDKNCEFVMRLDADHIIPRNYLSTIVTRIIQNPEIAMASGIIEKEYSSFPRGSGRVVRVSFWKKIGMIFPVNFGPDAYLALKAQSLGYKIISYSDLSTYTLRKTGSGRNPKLFANKGKAMKALGYTFPYVFLAFLQLLKQNPQGSFHMMNGYLSKYDDLYDSDLRDFVRKTQHKNLIRIDKGFRHILASLRYNT
jgi:glycosyltransferase involved in cell wall biosynthesis